MVVLLRHTFNSIDLPIARQQEWLASPLALLLNAQGAVQLFFVLSGFVLSGSLARNEQAVDHWKFAARRVCRIHLPYVAAVLFAFAASHFYREMSTGSGTSAWFAHFLAVRVELRDLVAHLLFPGTAGNLLDVGWTLRIELAVSFLLPFMWIAARRIHWAVLIVCALPLVLGSSWRPILYLFDFAIGMVIYIERERLLALAARFPRPAALLLLGGGLALFVSPMFATPPATLLDRVAPGFRASDIFVMGIGSAGLILASMAFRPMEWLLCTRPVAFLGRVSFSLYLFHKTILHLLVPLFAPLDTALAIALLYGAMIGTSLLAAALVYALVERPAIELGRLASRAVASWAGRAKGG